MIYVVEGPVEDSKVTTKCGGTVNIGGCSNLPRQILKGNIFRKENTTSLLEMVHGRGVPEATAISRAEGPPSSVQA